MSTFQVVLTLKDNDSECHRIGEIINAICDREGLAGGGGYEHGRPEGDNLICLVFQRNTTDGKLADVTGDDLTFAGRVLADHPNVARFMIGPIESCGRSFAQMGRDEQKLIEAFRYAIS